MAIRYSIVRKIYNIVCVCVCVFRSSFCEGFEEGQLIQFAEISVFNWKSKFELLIN